MLVSFILFYCGTNTNLISAIMCGGLAFLVLRPICFYTPKVDQPGVIASVVVLYLGYSISCCVVTMGAIYVSKLHNTVKTTNMENAKLLDGMHEGILILSKKERRAMFCNSPAEKLLSQYLGATSEHFKETKLKQAVFEAIKLTVRDSDNNDQDNSTKDINKGLLSLEDIIILQEDEPKQKRCIYSLKKYGSNLNSLN